MIFIIYILLGCILIYRKILYNPTNKTQNVYNNYYIYYNNNLFYFFVNRFVLFILFKHNKLKLI